MLSPSRPQNRMTHQKRVLKEERNDTQHIVFDVAHNIVHNVLCASSTKMETEQRPALLVLLCLLVLMLLCRTSYLRDVGQI
jgi:hypothetical protein